MRNLRHYAALFCLALYTFGVAEVCVRLMSPQPLMPRYITGTPWGVRGNIPHAAYRHKTPEVNVEYRINGEGMRSDREFYFKKPQNTCRIALFGDSFFMGYELDLRDTLASQLEVDMKNAGYRVEVLNFAVSGFGTGEMLRTYLNYAQKFDPDVTIFQWHASDLEDNVRSGLYALQNDKVVPASSEYLPSVSLQDSLMKWRVYRFVADNSHFYSWVRERTALLVKQVLLDLNRVKTNGSAHASSVSQSPQTESNAPEIQYSNRLSAELLVYAKESVISDGRSFLVVDIPEPLSRTSFKSAWRDLPQQTVSGINVVSASDVFSKLASPKTKLYYEQGHGHITPIAAHALAQTVADRVEKSSRLEICR